jgi:hypothetical protein
MMIFKEKAYAQNDAHEPLLSPPPRTHRRLVLPPRVHHWRVLPPPVHHWVVLPPRVHCRLVLPLRAHCRLVSLARRQLVPRPVLLHSSGHDYG